MTLASAARLGRDGRAPESILSSFPKKALHDLLPAAGGRALQRPVWARGRDGGSEQACRLLDVTCLSHLTRLGCLHLPCLQINFKSLPEVPTDSTSTIHSFINFLSV